MGGKEKRNTGVRRVWVQTLLILAAAAALWVVSLVNGEKALSYEADVQVRYQGDGAPAEIVKKMRSDGGVPAETAAWNVEYRVEAVNPSLSFKQEVTCILVEGDKSQVVKDRLVAGGYGYADDEEGCVVSSKTAWKLFGSTSVVGQWITVKGKRYIIRGVTADTTAMVILSSGQVKPDFFKNVSFSYERRGSHAGETEALLVRYGFPRGEVMVDGSFFGAAVRLCRILPLSALLLIVWLLLGAVLGKKENPCLQKSVFDRWDRSRLLLSAARASAAAAVVILIVREVRIPEDLLPTRWSDFDFYVQKYHAIQENLLRIDMLPLSEWDVEVKRAFAASALFSAEAALLLVTAVFPAGKAVGLMEKAASPAASAGGCRPNPASKISVDGVVSFEEPEAEQETAGLGHRDCQPDSVQPQDERHDKETRHDQNKGADKGNDGGHFSV